ncbi:MAG: phosphoribosylanthranilate isomerase [Oscillospiraceae bacterium]|nr:phosphoribosylanthranilate isomerase [Oscillospiraceae bacterium]
MSVKIKLCGMFRECDIDYANEAQPDYIGFVLEFPKSHRSIDKTTAQRLRSRLSPEIKTVGVFVNSPETTCAEYANCGIIDLIQLHGGEDKDYIRRLRELTDAPIIKAVKVRSADDIAQAQTLGADFLLLDNGTGTGQSFDHSLIDRELIRQPFFLAGGLTPENLRRAALDIRPYCVDLSSGIETDRVKDREKMLAAVRAVRDA